MDRQRYSSIAHRTHVYHSPMSWEKAQLIEGFLELPEGARVLSVGVGNGEFIIHLADAAHGSGVGIDASPYAIEEAQRLAKISSSNVEFLQREATEYEARGEFHAALCIGATHAYGGLIPAAKALAEHVRPGGRIVIGEGFWRREPAPEYLAAMGATADAMKTHLGNFHALAGLGLEPLATLASTEAEWDEYEARILCSIMSHVAANPEDPDVDTMRKQALGWHGISLRWGRETMGFGFYVLRRPVAE